MKPFNTTVYKTSDGVYKCLTRDGEVISQSSTTPETVLQAAYDRKGSIFISDDVYTMSGSFAGLKIRGQSWINASYNTKFIVPNGYTGDMFIVDVNDNAGGSNNSYYITTNGNIEIKEAGTPAKLWNGLDIKLNGINMGCSSCKFEGLNFYNPGVGILFNLTDITCWLTSNTFENINIVKPKVGVEWRTGVTDQSWSSSLHFNEVQIQYDADSSRGWKTIHGNNHIYSGCEVWDNQLSTVTPNHYTAHFTQYCTNQLIIGGIMTIDMLNDAPKGHVRYNDAHGPKPLWQNIEEIYQTNGDGVTRTFSIPHGKGITPTTYSVIGISKDALIGPFRISSVDSTNIIIEYTGIVPPPATVNNQNNLKWIWRANVR